MVELTIIYIELLEQSVQTKRKNYVKLHIKHGKGYRLKYLLSKTPSFVAEEHYNDSPMTKSMGTCNKTSSHNFSES